MSQLFNISKRTILILAPTFVGIGIFLILWIIQAPFPLEHDEVHNLTLAMSTWRTSIEYGPAYGLLYYALVQTMPNVFVAFFVKQVLTIFLIILVSFVTTRLFAIDTGIAAGIVVWLAVCLLDFNGTKEVAFLFAAVGSLFAIRWPRYGWPGFFLFLTIAFFTRTEYIVGLVIGVVLLFPVALTRTHRPGYSQGAWIGMFTGLVCIVICVMAYEPGGRSWVAFGQHFAINYMREHDLPGNPWIEYEQIIAEQFPTSDSVGDAMLENLSMVLWHSGMNVMKQLPKAVIWFLTPDSLLPDSALWKVVAGGSIVLLLGVLTVIGGLHISWYSLAVRPLLALTPIPLVATVMVMPLPQHLFPLLPLLTVLIGTGVSRCWQHRVFWLRLVPRLIGGVMMVAVIITASGMISHLVDPKPSVRSLVPLIQEQASIDYPIRILSSFEGRRLCDLADTPFCSGLRVPAGSTPSEYADEEHINWFLISDSMRERTDVQNDQVMQELIQRPTRFGCAAIPVTREGFLLIRCEPFFSQQR